MTTVAVASTNVCPICRSPKRPAPDDLLFHNARLCKRCADGFANRRGIAFAIDLV